MKHSRILAHMARKWILCLFIILSTSKSQCQTNTPPPNLLCISDCETCPVICSPPPSPTSYSSSPPPTPKLPPPSQPPPSPPPPSPVHHYSPPQTPYYYFTSPPPSSSPPAHPSPPSPPSYTSGGGGAAPPPPQVYVYNPGTVTPPITGQRNFSFPYYYFYSSKASSCCFPLHQGSILLVLFIFFQVLYE